MPYRLRRRASADLEDIYGFGVDRWGEDQAEAYAAKFWETVALIEAAPLQVRERAEITPPVRVRPFGSHLIVYVVDGDVVDVLRIAHARADWPNALT